MFGLNGRLMIMQQAIIFILEKALINLYNSVMIYSSNEYYLKALEKDKPYYFQIEAFNENGISPRTSEIKAE
jgi:hypothetical protein